MTQDDLIKSSTYAEHFQEETVPTLSVPIIKDAEKQVAQANASILANSKSLQTNISNLNAVVTQMMKINKEWMDIQNKYYYDDEYSQSFNLPGIRQQIATLDIEDTQRDAAEVSQIQELHAQLEDQVKVYESFCRNDIIQINEAFKKLQATINAYNLILLSTDKNNR